MQFGGSRPIIRYVIANLRLVKLGTTQAQRKLFFNLNKEKEKLERMGIAPGPKLLAEKLQVREQDVVEMEQRLAAPDLSVDAPVQGESDSTLHSVLPSVGPSSEYLLSRKQQLQLLQTAYDDFQETLKEKEKIIFRRRMLSENRATLQDLSDTLGISRERVRQIENRLKEKLKAFLEAREEGQEFDTNTADEFPSG